MYDIRLNTEDLTYTITDIDNKNQFKSKSPSKNLRMLKRDVKLRLKKLGCEFDYEVRKNENG